MFKKLFLLSFLVCFVLGNGFLLAGPPGPPKESKKPLPPKILPMIKPDLLIVKYKYEGKDATFPPGPPIPVRQGSSPNIEISIKNWTVGGEVDIVDDFSIGIYLCSEFGAGCKTTPYKLWSTTVSGGIKAGEIKSFSINITIPGTVPPGIYYMYPMVDDTNKIDERNEKANCYNSVALEVIKSER